MNSFSMVVTKNKYHKLGSLNKIYSFTVLHARNTRTKLLIC